MEDLKNTQPPTAQRASRADRIHRLREQIAEAERQGRPADLARQLLALLERPS